ncbi:MULTISPECIES: M1 family metallopeptidase [Myxococcaceae]|uniref:M1 family metallopeptidase n=1 Tax=Myxococcaceae TaxID=31 RepID=UPI001E405B97|nr:MULTISPECIES: M1 family metallopeptidase [Myxococcaceae]
MPRPVAPKLRLPEGVKPTAYSAMLVIHPDEPRFAGRVEIEVDLEQPTDTIWLHAHELWVEQAHVQVGDARFPLEARRGDDDFLGLHAMQPLPKGHAKVSVAYTGRLSTREVDGVFRVQEGNDWYVFTQFEPLAARTAFPCFDEPGFKTPWTLTLVVPQGQTAVTNTPQVSAQNRPDGMQVVKFAPSEPLPSYLVAFGVGPFDVKEAKPSGSRKVPTRILTPRGRAVEATYAAEVTPAIIDQLEKYFGIPYPYAKLDLLAVPLLDGAMENAGLVTFNSGSILSRPDEDTLSRQRRFASVDAHELAHQWFGDLVTMAWWDDLWLNEAFATWMSSHVLVDWQPTWGESLERVSGRSEALQDDSLVSARRIRQPIESENDVYNAFDGITYGKGAAVLRMTEAWLGADVFQKGVQRHLKGHAYGSATVDDFVHALAAEAGKDLGPVLSTFLEQTGAPLVSAKLECQKGQGTATLRLAQERYRPVGSKADAAQTWKVPLCVRYAAGAGSQRACTLLDGKEGALQLEAPKGCPAWVMPNADGAGYYRSALEPAALQALLSTHARQLTAEERVALLGDAGALVRANRLPVADAMALVRSYAGAPEREVVLAAVDLLGVLREELLPAELLPERERFVREVFAGRARVLGLTPKEGESEDARLLRPKLVALVAQHGHDETLINQAQVLAQRWLANHGVLEPERVDPVLAVAAAGNDPQLHAALLAEVKRAPDRKLRQQLLRALSNFQDPALVRANLALVLQGNLDPREAGDLLFGAANDVRTRQTTYDWVKQNYDTLAGRLPESVTGRIALLAQGFCSPEARADVASFFGPRNEKAQGGPRTLANVLEEIDLCVALKEAQGASAAAFLKPAAANGKTAP